MSTETEESLEGREGYAFSLTFIMLAGGGGVCPEEDAGAGAQIDYPACSQRVQGLCGQAAKK